MSEELLSLVEAFKNGTKEASSSLIQECGKIIRACLLKYCRGRPEEIDDITGEVWVKLFRGGLKDFSGASQYQFLAYLKKITINEANTHFRLRGKPKQEVSADRFANPNDKGQPIEITDEATGPEEIIILKSEVDGLRECLKNLTVVQQEIAMMKAREYKDAEIAEIFGMPLGTVAVSWSRLKIRTRECMEKREKIKGDRVRKSEPT